MRLQVMRQTNHLGAFVGVVVVGLAVACSSSSSKNGAAPGDGGTTDGAGANDASTPDAGRDAVPDGAGPGDDGGPGGQDSSAGNQAAPPGCPPGDRYTVLTPGTSTCDKDGSGLVRDNSTGLTWMVNFYLPSLCSASAQKPCQAQAQAAAYCAGANMRLPTEDEALGIATNFEPCAWPCPWQTWTSSPADLGHAWCVYSSGNTFAYDVGGIGNFGVLCVRGS